MKLSEAPSRRTITLLVVFAFYCLPFVLHAQEDNDTCMACHGQADMGAPLVDASAFQQSIHGKHLCLSCHKDAATLPHPDKLAPVSCGTCHRVETQIYLNSDHGKAVLRGRQEAASCKDCHGHSHTLLNSRDLRSPVNRKNIIGTCAHCHADTKRMETARLSERDPLNSYNHTVHGEAFAAGKTNAAICSDCHGTHDLHGSLNPLSRIFRTKIPDTCGRCHQNVGAVFWESIHGQAIRSGIKEAPVCTDCHGEHTIRPVKDKASSAYVGAVTKTCSVCHSSEKLILKFGLPSDRLETYSDTYHGLAAQRGDLRVANCASCHGFHDVLPSVDPRSSVHRKNLPNTCGRCHPGARPQLATGYVHGPPTAKHWTIFAASVFYLIVIPFTVIFMFFHNGIDWLKKSWAGWEKEVSHRDEIRLTRNERWQHAFLALTFILLALSGFALKFPEESWAKIFIPLNEEMRRWLHRWSALVFTVLAFYHAGYLALTRRGRTVVRELLPKKEDAKDFLERMAYNTGQRQTPPQNPAYYHYPEKIEYWSLVWGSVIMIVTGAILVFNNFILKHFPLWLSDLATMVHYYEAVLACLAILIWHFYGVIFDPVVYPMNWSWLTGTIRRKKESSRQ